MNKIKYFLANGDQLQLPTSILGEGGEAYVYKISKSQVAKIYKEANDTCFTTLPGKQADEAIAMAKQRLIIYNEKLKVYPKGLPTFVLSPNELIFDQNGNVKGYIMPLVDNPMTWLQYADPGKRRNNLANDQMTKSLLLLHEGTAALHTKNIIIGDYNDNNFLVKNGKVFFVDSDAYQLNKYACLTFTQTYVDPRICQKSPHSDSMIMTGNHNKDTDWYAFNVFVSNTLLCWHPYVGQHKPSIPSNKIPNGIRPLKRFTVLDEKNEKKFRDDILLPKFYLDLAPNILTDELAHQLWQTFTKDKRGEFPKTLLTDLQWTTCKKCGTYHARHQCPSCLLLIRPLKKEIEKVHGTVFAKILFQQQIGAIISSTLQYGKLLYLYHDGNNFIRENGNIVIPGNMEPGIRWELCGNKTLLGKDRSFWILEPGNGHIAKSTSVFAGYPIFSTNSRYYFWIENGEIRRNIPGVTLGSDYLVLGKVTQDKTLLWTGETFGFGVWGNSSLYYFFCFDTEKRNYNDDVKINLKGDIIDASCSFTEDRCWFFIKHRLQNGGKIINSVYVIGKDGKLIGKLEDTNKSWTNSVRGKAALSDKCLVNTDDGVYQLGIVNEVVTELKHFPDTAPWGDDLGRLHFLDGKLIVNDGKIITELTMK